MTDTYNLTRFTKAQEDIYDTVLDELKNGHKTSHWIWFIFPQITGLGRSETAQYYAIQNKKEALEYLEHPILGGRLIKCTKMVLTVEGRTISQIFGYPDDMKFISSMTLFATVSDKGSVFEKALEQYYNGERDSKTMELI